MLLSNRILYKVENNTYNITYIMFVVKTKDEDAKKAQLYWCKLFKVHLKQSIELYFIKLNGLLFWQTIDSKRYFFSYKINNYVLASYAHTMYLFVSRF